MTTNEKIAALVAEQKANPGVVNDPDFYDRKAAIYSEVVVGAAADSLAKAQAEGAVKRARERAALLRAEAAKNDSDPEAA
jgi:hypothetical protein